MSIPSLSTTVPGDFRSTQTLVRQTLAAEGFGVLTEIDVRSTLHQKLGAEMEDYLILGVCNPSLAHQALEIDRSVGLLLPCTVVVRASAAVGVTIVEAQDPTVMVALTGLAELQPVAEDAGARLRRALASLPSASVSMTR